MSSALRLRGAALTAAILTLKGHIAAGTDDVETAIEMGLSAEELASLKREMLRQMEAEIRQRDNPEWFALYKLDQDRNIADLTRMIGEFHTSKQYNAMVGAIRTRAQIQDNVIKMGFDLGVIEKEPERKEIVGIGVVAEMSLAELKKALATEVTGFTEMVERHRPISIIDMEPGSLHRSAPKTKALPPPAPVPAAASKRHGGRKTAPKARKKS